MPQKLECGNALGKHDIKDKKLLDDSQQHSIISSQWKDYAFDQNSVKNETRYAGYE